VKPGSQAARVRVIHLLLNVEAGGLEAVVLNLVARSDRSRFEHRVVCLEGLGALAPGFRRLDVPLESLSATSRLGALARLAPKLRQLRPDVLHSHNAKPHIVAAAARSLGLVPVLVHTKHGRNQPQIFRWRVWNHLASRASDAVVAVSQDAALVARRLEWVPERKLRVLHNGVETAVAQRAALPGARARAVCVARLHPVKDHETLLRAARLVSDARPDFELLLAGDGPERERLEKLSGELRLESVVRFLGRREDVRELLAGADLFVLASRSEGISLGVLEAMAAALPVVATAVGGNCEAVVEGETGLLVPPESPAALAEAILRLLGDPGVACAQGAAGRTRVERSFSLDAMVTRYEALYSELLGRSNPC
jgi:glycosyltransferase involved in cell wall biosynthesis